MPLDVFGQISIVIVVAALVAVIMRLLKQPLIIGYIITGILVGPSFMHLIKDPGAFETFSEIGIALLLFIIGLELKISVIKRLGMPVFVTTSVILLTVGTLGLLTSIAFGFTGIEAVIIGLGLFFSSTIIIAKLLSDKKELDRLNGQIAIGIILLDDIVATFALLFVGAQGSLDSSSEFGLAHIAGLIVKGLLLLGAMIFVSTKILPRITKFMAKSQELLFLFALAWGFGIATIVSGIGFSIEIGALFAGVCLAQLPYAHQIGARLKPLRDFFIIIFFITLGEQLHVDHLSAVIVPVIVLSALVMIVKPLAVLSSLGVLGYTRRTSFKTAINVSQISEFSIILAVLAVSSGVVSAEVGTIITLVAMITIAISTYLIQYDNVLYPYFEKHLQMFEKKGANESSHNSNEYPLVLFGHGDGGSQYIKTFKDLKKPFVVVDYDPDVIENLERSNIEYMYGDATDPELLGEIKMDSVKFVINTIGDHEVNTTVVRYIRRKNKDAVIVCSSSDYNKAAELYKLGASYVMLPNLVGSEKLNSFIQMHGISQKSFDAYREKHMMKVGRAAIGRG